MNKENIANDNRTNSLLMSIIVMTYNSGKTVIDTLESIKNQTYYNIELIITDDHSSDNTVDLCRGWLLENGTRFPFTKLVTSDINTGIIGNIKRGRAYAHGDWFKDLAGDDQLIPTAIEDYMQFVGSNNDIKICISDVELFSDEGSVPEERVKEYEMYFKHINCSYKDQWLRCLQENVFVGPGLITSKKLYQDLETVSSKWGNADEWPFFYSVLKSGNQIYTIDKKLVRYRFSTSSISHTVDKKGLRNRDLVTGTCKFFFERPFNDLLKEKHYLIAWDRYLHYRTMQYYYEVDGALLAGYLKDFSKFLSPYGYYKRIKRLLNNKYVNI